MASERSTDVQAFIGELDGGVFETKIGAVLSDVCQSRWSPDYSAGRPGTVTDSCR